MSTNRFLIVFIIFTFPYIVLNFAEGLYTIVAPGTVRTDSFFNLSIAVSDTGKINTFRITLKSRHDKDKNLSSTKFVKVNPNTRELVSMRVPSFHGNKAVLEVIGTAGIVENKTRQVNIERGSHAAFIQTNKAKYKPGELVQFRVIFIDRLTRPAQITQKISVLIYNSEEYLLKHFDNVKLVHGVFKGEFQLTESPDFGEWKIKVEVDGDAEAERSFLVDKYVLPIFAVRVSTKPNVAIDENELVLMIRANYFYGKPVKGNLTVILNNTKSALQTENLPLFERNLQFDESTTLVLDLKKDLQIDISAFNGLLKLYKFYVKVIATDSSTEQQSWTETEITIHSKPYIFKLQSPKVFDEGQDTFKTKLSITDLNGRSIEDAKSEIEIVTECINNKTNEVQTVIQKVMPSQLGKFLNIKVPHQDRTNYVMYAKYKGVKSHKNHIVQNTDKFSLEVLTENPEVGKKIEVKLKSQEAIEFFSYEVVCRGQIIHSDYVNVTRGEKEYIIRMEATFIMIPKVTIYVHRLKGGVFAGQLKEFYVKSEFQNKIKISTDAEAKPGSSVRIDVDTNPDSYVGLMGLDYRILENSQTSSDLTKEHFYTKLKNFDASNIDHDDYPGNRAGLITISNIFQIGTRVSDDGVILPPSERKPEELPDEFDKPILDFPRIRKLFSESWLYMDFESAPKHLNFNQTTPDTITSWAITGFSLNNETGLTLTENATNLKVFQDFFVSFDLPVLIKEGETIEVPIFIRNYKNSNVATQVKIEKHDDELEILKNPQTLLGPEEKLSITVPANGIRSLTVFLRPKKSGEFNVTVKALSSVASDAMQKTLNVQPDGIKFAISTTHLVYLPESGRHEDTLTIDIPDNAVQGSQKVEISTVGDIFKPLMNSLLDIARSPFGNGEENMKKVYSNLLVLKYLKVSNYKHPKLENKFKDNLVRGYAYQLDYFHLDGSFGLFNKKTPGVNTGDVRRTAFALWGLHLAQPFITVDSKVFVRGLGYLEKHQNESGCFRTSNGSDKDDIESTALSLMVFLGYNANNTYEEIISKGLRYLNEVAGRTHEDTSIVFLSTSVLLNGQHENSRQRLTQLIEKNSQFRSANNIEWKKPDTWQSQLENTAHVLLKLFELKSDMKKQLLELVRGLIASDTQESSATQMMALYMMVSVIQNLDMNNKDLSVKLKHGKHNLADFRVDSKNSALVQTLPLFQKHRLIDLECMGHGFALVNVKYRYNLLPEEIKSSSKYNINVRTVSSKGVLSVFQVCLKYLENRANHLTYVVVNLQSGLMFTERITPQVGLIGKVKSITTHGQRERLEVYIENLDAKGSCLELEVLKRNNVIDVKPGSIIAHDIDNKAEKAFSSFKIDES